MTLTGKGSVAQYSAEHPAPSFRRASRTGPPTQGISRALAGAAASRTLRASNSLCSLSISHHTPLLFGDQVRHCNVELDLTFSGEREHAQSAHWAPRFAATAVSNFRSLLASGTHQRTRRAPCPPTGTRMRPPQRQAGRPFAAREGGRGRLRGGTHGEQGEAPVGPRPGALGRRALQGQGAAGCVQRHRARQERVAGRAGPDSRSE